MPQGWFAPDFFLEVLFGWIVFKICYFFYFR